MSVTLSSTSINNYSLKKPMDLPLKRELVDNGEFNNEDNLDNKNNEPIDSISTSDGNSEASDLENSGPSSEGVANNIALDYTENSLNLHPVAEFIKKEFLPDFDFGNNLFRNQNVGFKADGFGNHARSPFLLPTQLYKNFLATLEKRKRNMADCYSLYPRNMLFTNNFAPDVSDDELNGDRNTDSPNDEVNYLILCTYPFIINFY